MVLVFAVPVTVTESVPHPLPPIAHIVRESVPALTPDRERVVPLTIFPCAIFAFELAITK